jgi:hypothetical protein
MQARSFFLFLALCFLVARVSAKTAAEKLVDLTNDYREENGLPRITMSYSLTKVRYTACINFLYPNIFIWLFCSENFAVYSSKYS